MRIEGADVVRFCCCCGARLAVEIPPGDDHERQVCRGCGYIDYQNPRILVTCMIHRGDGLLWIRRAREPGRGRWAIPGGFVELGENLQEAACREIREETGVELQPWSLSLYGVGSLPLVGQVYITFRALLDDQDFGPTDEALDVSLMSASELDWSMLAYPEIGFHVRRFYREMAMGEFGVYLGEVNAELGVRVLETGKSHAIQRLIHDFSL